MVQFDCGNSLNTPWFANTADLTVPFVSSIRMARHLWLAMDLSIGLESGISGSPFWPISTTRGYARSTMDNRSNPDSFLPFCPCADGMDNTYPAPLSWSDR